MICKHKCLPMQINTNHIILHPINFTSSVQATYSHSKNKTKKKKTGKS